MAMDKIIHLSTQSTEEAVKIKNMKAEIEREKVHQQWNRLQLEKKQREGLLIDEEKAYQPGSLTAKNKKFQEVMQKKMPFINSVMSKFMPVAAGTIYLLGAITGGGKSSTVANIVIPLIEERKRILIISNEEARNHVYVRIACRLLGYNFKSWTESKLSQTILDQIDRECERLTRIVTVIGTDFQDNPKFVTTPEGLEIVFDAFSKDHDAILFDYFQNISHSIVDPDPKTWPHQEKFCYFINDFKNRFDGPIFIMSQLWPTNKNNTIDFLERIKGRKAIGDIALVHIEIRPSKSDFTSTFIVHKDRLWSNDGFQVIMGFDKDSGRIVPYDDAFKLRAAGWIQARMKLLSEDADEAAVEQASQTAAAHTEIKQEEEAKNDFSDELNLDMFDS